MTRKERARDLHRRGYNCAQAVACTFADAVGLAEDELFRIMEGFGFGMGTMGTCGALSGAAAVIGLMESSGPDDPNTKKNTYRLMKQITADFDARAGSHICAEIRGSNGGAVLRSCDGCIEDAVAILEDYLAAHKQT